MRVLTAVVVAAMVVPGCRCANHEAPATSNDADVPKESAEAQAPSGQSAVGLSLPIAATQLGSGEVLVAGLDVPAGAVRVQRISAQDAVVAERTVFSSLAWSSEASLTVTATAGGAFVTWRGLREKKLVRQALALRSDLTPIGAPVDVPGTSCATEGGLWSADGAKVQRRMLDGGATDLVLPKDKEAGLLCGARNAWTILDEDDRTSVAPLSAAKLEAQTLLEERDFPDDEQRERAEYAIGDDMGFVRLGASGAIALREIRKGVRGPLRKLKTRIPHDDDVVAVDASSQIVTIVYTEDVSSSCPAEPKGTTVSTKVVAIRVSRESDVESVLELSPGNCGHEVGPFFTGVVGEGVMTSWVERLSGVGKSRAPIAGLAYRVVPAKEAPPALGRIEQPADAVVDAGCSGRCFAVALARKPGASVMIPGVARVLRYP